MTIFVYLCNPERGKRQFLKKNGVIAQLVEQRTENPCVPGSIPGDTTLKVRELQKCSSLFLFYLYPCFKAVQQVHVNRDVNQNRL